MPCAIVTSRQFHLLPVAEHNNLGVQAWGVNMRWLTRLISLVIVLAAISILGLIFIPTERIAKIATDQFEASTGRALRFTGKIRPRFFPVIGVRADGLEIANADWASNRPMVKAKRVLVGVSLTDLIGGNITIKELRIKSPEVLLERNASGVGNWEFETTSTDEAGEGLAIPEFSLPEGWITNGSIRYIDYATDQDIQLEAINVIAKIPGFSHPVTLGGKAIYQGEKIAFSIVTQDLKDGLTGATVPFHGGVNLGTTAAEFDGVAGFAPLNAEGSATLRAEDLAGLLALVDMAAPAGVDNAGFSGKVTYTADGEIFIRSGRLAAGDLGAGVDADITFADRPKITARVSAGNLDFAPFIPKGSSDTGTSDGWDKTPIDGSALGLLDFDIALSADSLNLVAAKLGKTKLRAVNDRSRLVITISGTHLYQGSLTGSFVANARNDLSVSADISANGVALRPFLSDFAGYDRLAGAANFNLKVLGGGTSQDAIVRSLDGGGSLAIGAGEIIGFDLGGMIRNLDVGFQGSDNKTIFEGVTASFSIANGVANNQDMRFLSPVTDATGAGVMNLGAQSLDYTITPVSLAPDGTASTHSLSYPVRIFGPLSNLGFAIDLEGLLQGNLDEKLKLIEEGVRTNLETAVQNQLNDSGSSVEETLQNSLEGQAGDVVNNLLNGLLDN